METTAIFNGKKVPKSTADTFLNTVQCGDCLTVLHQLPDSSVDTVITSPPYFQQRNYSGIGIGNEASVKGYIASLTDAFGEIIRVTKSTGNIVYNIGDKYQKGNLLLVPYQFALSITEQFPVRLVNNITWVKSNPTPRQFTRRLVSATEPFFHFVKTTDYYYDRDEFQKSKQTNLNFHSKPSPRLGGKYRELIKQSSLTQQEKNNAIKSLDGVIQEVKNGDIKGFRMKIRGVHAPAFGGQDGGRKTQMEQRGFTIIKIHGNPLKRDVIESAVESGNGSGHSAIYPLSIIRELVRLLCPPDGVVLDPYMGSGTTLVATKKEGRYFIGIDINPQYCNHAKKWVTYV